MQSTDCLRGSAGRLRRGGDIRIRSWYLSRDGRPRETGGTVAENPVKAQQRFIGYMRTRFGEEGGGRLDRRRAIGVLNPCERESKAQTGRFLRGKTYEDQQGAAKGHDPWGVLQECPGFWTAGCWLARRLHQLKASTTMDLGISIFLISA